MTAFVQAGSVVGVVILVMCGHFERFVRVRKIRSQQQVRDFVFSLYLSIDSNLVLTIGRSDHLYYITEHIKNEAKNLKSRRISLQLTLSVGEQLFFVRKRSWFHLKANFIKLLSPVVIQTPALPDVWLTQQVGISFGDQTILSLTSTWNK